MDYLFLCKSSKAYGPILIRTEEPKKPKEATSSSSHTFSPVTVPSQSVLHNPSIKQMALSLTSSFLQIKPLSPPPLSLRKVKVNAGMNSNLQVTCRKKDIHPQFYEDAKVYCNGELVMTTGGTQKEYVVDVWSGNHPFYLGNRSAVVVDADQVEKFRKKFGELSQLMEIPVLKGEIVLPTKSKFGGKKKK
ncbi:hypothetical protein JCGZ_04464 [Jatropha curcas]|uniref:Large ribosomal subunit protein bL31c n=1 Tax=Jatropha curcas TaxID=180498 RepID=A0A067L368_JATCU|nr:50S ribosomal protein L31, chloroplastic [Jatropha curcas]XP_012071903.2 50S ribosomal protein L31, chloroplastic [Jatropha curcas]XP_020534761.1 50S ribosomal protein L31, chloroplastic [Jatropha curcas]XP_020534763.1 50S ribosomal protein L31, chloroplastic [Jatropha curcas]XP_020534764.1 50S ribosomal protein L31, chloroplastic [Jatropha curcas]KDP38539.1 hypothetical protein JCGZ_04464 [Jatropha curcas]